jgi:hypothetical protein
VRRTCVTCATRRRSGRAHVITRTTLCNKAGRPWPAKAWPGLAWPGFLWNQACAGLAWPRFQKLQIFYQFFLATFIQSTSKCGHEMQKRYSAISSYRETQSTRHVWLFLLIASATHTTSLQKQPWPAKAWPGLAWPGLAFQKPGLTFPGLCRGLVLPMYNYPNRFEPYNISLESRIEVQLSFCGFHSDNVMVFF